MRNALMVLFALLLASCASARPNRTTGQQLAIQSSFHPGVQSPQKTIDHTHPRQKKDNGDDAGADMVPKEDLLLHEGEWTILEDDKIVELVVVSVDLTKPNAPTNQRKVDAAPIYRTEREANVDVVFFNRLSPRGTKFRAIQIEKDIHKYFAEAVQAQTIVFQGQSSEPLILQPNVEEFPETTLRPIKESTLEVVASLPSCGIYFQGTELRRNVSAIYFFPTPDEKSGKSPIHITYPGFIRVIIDDAKQVPTVELRRDGEDKGFIRLRIARRDYDQAPCLPGI